MKDIAVIFSHSPHGNNIGREGLDLAISLTPYTKKIGIFFLSDGIFQFLKKKNIKEVYSSNYSDRFQALFFLGVRNFYCDYQSLKDRGVLSLKNFLFPIKVLNTRKFMKKINDFDHILNF
ncbi:sulfurtransferase complex subunit TusC [Buchnera aphidicola]|uniref:sulfurtransferase complex subunit TusC n=1 Tax=Buchnera aphidicola TaxID=9 RepID=UPI0020928ADC|nr:sulfurtransferase complex subunit TusC [Buchnera aphidicola]USS94092.1 sulfurtransferase complex subunit TusC [Buchnera aphidicola (Sipha maydis)]WII23637.1 sulfurtransferase complex subunit TusC [Buchnera aphidicola (Sipha maydis)]